MEQFWEIFMKKNKFIDFVNRTGKNIGEIQNIKLANFIGVSESANQTNEKERLRQTRLHISWCFVQSK